MPDIDSLGIYLDILSSNLIYPSDPSFSRIAAVYSLVVLAMKYCVSSLILPEDLIQENVLSPDSTLTTHPNTFL